MSTPVTFRNAAKQAFPKTKFANVFWPSAETTENVSRDLYARVYANDQQTCLARREIILS
jgi:hypothetical protein